MNDLEHLLERHTIDINTLNKRSVIQNDVIDIPRNIPEPVIDKHARAEGNAQIIDFFTMVGEMVENVMSTTQRPVLYIPDSKSYFKQEDADERFKNPIVTFMTKHRKIKDKTNKTPKLHETLFEEDDDRTGSVYTISYESIIRFKFKALEYDTAFELMTEFENMMEEYRYYIKQKGIVDYYLLEQQEDTYSVDFRDLIDVLTLDYYVVTQKNRVIFKENAKTLIINGEAVNNDYTPIPTAPEYNKEVK